MTSKGHWVSDAELKREAQIYTKAYGITETTYSMNVKEAIERAHGIGQDTILQWALTRKIYVGLSS